MPQSKILIPTLFSLLILLVVLIGLHAYTDKRQHEMTQLAYQQKSQEIHNTVNTLIQNQMSELTFIALSLAQDAQLKQALITHSPNNLSYQDYLHTLAEHSDLKPLWLHIVDRDGNSFYRSWTPKRGDNVLDARRDLQKMLQAPQILQVVSTGLYDMTFKSSVPIYDKQQQNKQLVGVFEVIGKFAPVVSHLKKRHIDSVLLADPVYKNQIHTPFSKRFVGSAYLVNPDARNDLIDTITRHNLLAYSERQPYFVDHRHQQLVVFYKQPNIAGDPMGHFFFFYPLSLIEQNLKAFNPFYLYLFTLLVYLFALISYFYWSYQNRARQIFDFNTHLTETVALKTEELSDQKQFLQNVMDGVTDAVTVYEIRDHQPIKVLINQAAKQPPFTAPAATQNTLRNAVNRFELYSIGRFQKACHTLVMDTFQNSRDHQSVLEYEDDHQQTHFFEVSATPLLDAQNKPAYVIQLGHDITHYLTIQNQVKQQKNELDFIAFHDPLTDLPNRALFLDRLNQAIYQAQRNQTKLAVLFIDLDRFKEINDAFGHNSGDEVLVVCAKRLRKCLRRFDSLARLGGDEFSVLLNALKNNNEIINTIDSIIHQLSAPIHLGEEVFHITASIGVTVFPHDGMDADQLLKNADAAMYQAKEDGKNTYHFYTKEMTDLAVARLSMENDLREAMAKNQFELYYQPQYDVDTDTIIGFEALVRWIHPERGLISPQDFIPIAEETGLILQLGRQVIDMATQTIAEWRRAGLTQGRLAINVSAKQLHEARFTQILSALLDKNDCLPEWIEIEITESCVMTNIESTLKRLQQIRRRGITLSIDDFGTGYSSLAYLKRLPITKVKIDRSFICDLPDDKDDAEITKAIISMSQSLNLAIIAEGIETEAQRDFVRAEGCHLIQGYLYSHPLSKADATAKLKALPTASNPSRPRTNIQTIPPLIP
ncbi:MAG: EAL domain-containing protein [Hydrogenovibrio sp.]